MPIEGNLGEFPLPEVLLFIGTRTGRLCLYDVPEFAEMEIELCEGQAHALHLGGSLLTEKSEIVAELSVIIETGTGRFQFHAQPVEPVEREHPFTVNDLVISLVMHVDVKMSRKRGPISAEHLYVLEDPTPEISIEPNLNLFYQQSLQWLTEGVSTEELAENLDLDNDITQLNLAYLRQLGFVKLIDGDEAAALREQKIESEITEKNSEYQFAAEASDLIMRSGKLWKLPPRKG